MCGAESSDDRCEGTKEPAGGRKPFEKQLIRWTECVVRERFSRWSLRSQPENPQYFCIPPSLSASKIASL